MIDYIELNCFIEPYREDIAEIIVAQLSDYDFESFDLQSDYVKAYIPMPKFDLSKVEKDGIINHLKKEYKISFSVQMIESKDWNAEWESNFQPIVLDNLVCIRGSFHEQNDECKHNIVINPKMSFGTGHHSTTALMLKNVHESVNKGDKVLDMGCGTSILGIYASMCGASEVTGIDIDEWAYNNSIENLSLNKISNVHIHLGDAGKLAQFNHFNLILANINRNILLNDMHYYKEHLTENGLLVMSGFYSQDVKLIKEEAEKNGLTFIDQKEDNNWVAIKFALNA